MRYRIPVLAGLLAAAVLFTALAMAGFAALSALLSALALGFAAFIVWITVKRVWIRNFGPGRQSGRHSGRHLTTRTPPT